MKTKLPALAATLALLAAAPAFAADSTYKTETEIKKDEDGSYKKTTSEVKKDVGGKASSETSVETEVNDDGSVDSTVKTEDVVDPKGLGNKEKVTTKDTVTNKDGKVVKKHVKKVNGETVEETEKEQAR